MPWRNERDPYRIWLSEVILQQTRVAQGEGYYRRFTRAYPTVEALAAAPEDDVMALWQGLGYYSRARNLHAAAKRVVARGTGFPKTYDALLELPGVGPYSAAAIASFASGEDVAVVDGNVYRVLARYFDIDAPIDTGRGQRTFRELADALLPRGNSSAYNQAIMDFGATVCTPRRPSCASCPLREGCAAFAKTTVETLPVKSKKLKRRTRYFDYLHLANETGAVFLRKRPVGDIWQGLYDLPLVESEPPLRAPTAAGAQHLLVAAFAETHAAAAFERVSAPVRHQLTHQELIIRFWRFGESRLPASDGVWVDPGRIASMGIPQPLANYLTESQLALGL